MKAKTERNEIYAEKFFDKKMHPGIMGSGFIGINEQGRNGKAPKPLFPTLDDLME